MTVEFQIKGKTYTGKVVGRGFHAVDAPESFEVEVNSYGFTKLVPVQECRTI